MPSDPYRFGPVTLAEGVRPVHAGTYLLAAFMGICLTTFISVITPYVLTVNLGLAAEEQGRVAGNMVFYGELVLLAFSSLVGAQSDRLGRRGMFVIGILIISAGYVLLGFVDSVATLTAVRVFMAFGIVVINVMVSALQMDYPAESSRGKFVGFAGIAIGIGSVLIGVLFARLPDIYAGNGADELTAGRFTMYTMAALAVVLAICLRAGLKGGPPPHADAHEPLRDRIRVGFTAGRRNARIALAYGCAFVSRADLVVVGTFYSLWLNQAGIQSGLSPNEAAKVAGGFFGYVMLCALIWAPVMGWLNDRFDRTRMMALAMGLASAGYLCMWLIPDPLGIWMYPGGLLLGIGQMSAVLASQTLVGQESPPAHRGSVVGMFSFFGAAGILFVTSVGGRIYDTIAPVAPFVLIGAVNGLLFLAAIVVAHRTRTATTEITI